MKTIDFYFFLCETENTQLFYVICDIKEFTFAFGFDFNLLM
jgi:hypothetical protein